MNTNFLSKSATFAALTAVLSYAATLHAAPVVVVQPVVVAGAGPAVQPPAFSDSAEGGMLLRAYLILATGDHDYEGHRVKAMHAIEAAAKPLGLTLKGEDKDHQRQAISDDKMREARDLISNVMASAAVKDQKRIVKHLNEAVHQINVGLHIK